MNEPTGPVKDYGAVSRQELRMDLEQYDFVTPTGEPLAPLLDPPYEPRYGARLQSFAPLACA
jgi:hypothetical protein